VSKYDELKPKQGWVKVCVCVFKVFMIRLQKNIANANIDLSIMMHYRDAVFKSRVAICSETYCIISLLQRQLQFSVTNRILYFLEGDTEIYPKAMWHYCELTHICHFRNEGITFLLVINQKNQ